MKKAFYLYQDQDEVINQLSDSQAGKLLKAIYQYGRGEEPELDKTLKLVFTPIKQGLDRNRENHERVSKINSDNIKKRWNQAQDNTTVYDRIGANTNEYDKDKDKDKDKQKKTNSFYEHSDTHPVQEIKTKVAAETLPDGRPVYADDVFNDPTIWGGKK